VSFFEGRKKSRKAEEKKHLLFLCRRSVRFLFLSFFLSTKKKQKNARLVTAF